METKYAHPPIVEAVCEFRVLPSVPWDQTVAQYIYEKLKDDFPHRERGMVPEYDVTPTEQGVEQKLQFVQHQFFFAADRKSFVQMGTRRMAIHVLHPYPSWEIWSSKIRDAFHALTDVVNIIDFQRIGLLYNNHIELPAGVEFGNYLDFHPYLGDNLPEQMKGFLVGCVFSFADDRDACKVQITTILSGKPDTVAFQLSLDYYLAISQGVVTDGALAWVDNAHREIKALFEGCICDPLRDIFGQES